MSLISGLDAIKKRAEGGNRRSTGGAKFLKLNDGDSVRVRFLQELDEAASGYTKEAGLGCLAVEYRDPNDFKRRALDTTETEGRCWMAEQGWKPRTSLYIAVLVTEGKDEGNVRILNQGLGPKSAAPSIIEYAGEFGTLLDREYRIKRSGSQMTDTQYVCLPLNQDKEPFDVTPFVEQIPDYSRLLQHIPYEKQAAFFGGGEAETEDDTW